MPDNIKNITLFVRIYNIFLALIYLCTTAFLIIFPILLLQDPTLPESERVIVLVVFTIMVLLVLAFLLAYIFGALRVNKRTKGNWIFQLILICIGLGSPITFIFSILLLIQWIKSDVKDYFYRTSPTSSYQPQS